MKVCLSGTAKSPLADEAGAIADLPCEVGTWKQLNTLVYVRVWTKQMAMLQPGDGVI